MDTASWFVRLEQTQTSYLLLAILAGTVAAAAILYQVGVDGLGLAWCGPGRAGRDPQRLLPLGAIVRVGFVAGIPGHRLRNFPPGRRGRWSIAWIEGRLRRSRHWAWEPSPASPTCASTWNEMKSSGATRPSIIR